MQESRERRPAQGRALRVAWATVSDAARDAGWDAASDSASGMRSDEKSGARGVRRGAAEVADGRHARGGYGRARRALVALDSPPVMAAAAAARG